MFDNQLIKMGDGDDLAIYHDTTAGNVIKSNNSFNLILDSDADIILDADGGDWYFKDGGTDIAHFVNASGDFLVISDVADKDIQFRGLDGSSQITALTLDMSDSGMAHFNNYIKVADRVVGSSNLILNTVDSNEKIHMDASGYMKFETNGAERMRLNGDGDIGLGTSSPSNVGSGRTFHIKGHNSDGANLRLQGQNDTADSNDMAIIKNDSEGIIKVFGSDSFKFNMNNADRMIINGDGDVLVGSSSFSNGSGDTIRLLGAEGRIDIENNSTSLRSVMLFYNPNGAVGNIRTTGSATQFNTSSDYRLKENVITDWDATTRLKQLKPSRFNFIADADLTVDGFLAHEVSDIVPEAISGEKDAVDSDGNPVYQGIDQSKLVPLLVKTIQELEARITTLENN
jgi:hypothetical protein